MSHLLCHYANTLAKIAIGYLLLIIFSDDLQAQQREISFKHLSTNEGLSNFTVLAISQDSYGFMWFGTQDGLNRYDGETIVTYRNIPGDSSSLGDNHVWALACQGDTGIWVGTQRGLFFYDYSSESFGELNLHAFNGVDHINVRSFTLTQDWLYIGGGPGLLRYNLKKKEFVPFREGSEDPYARLGTILDIFRDKNEIIWLASDSRGLVKLENNEFTTINLDLKGNDQYRISGRSVTVDTLGRVWLGTENFETGIVIYDTRKQVSDFLSTQNSILPQNQVRTLKRIGGNIWVGTREGLAIIDETQLVGEVIVNNKYDPYSLSNNSVRPIFQDQDGNVWVGTYSGGINFFNANSQRITHFTDKGLKGSSLSYNIISCIYQDLNGELWFGTENRGISIYNPRTAKYRYLVRQDGSGSLTHNNIKAIMEGEPGEFFIATNYGLSIYNEKLESFFNFYEGVTSRGFINNRTVHDLQKDHQGNVWLGVNGGQNSHFQVYDIKLDSIIHYYIPEHLEDKINAVLVNSLCFDDEKFNIWAGGDNGLSAFNIPDREYLTDSAFFVLKNHFSNTRVSDLTIDGNGLMWIATLGYGLYVVDLESFQFKPLDIGEKLKEKSFYSLISDGDGNIWAAYNSGILKISNVKPHLNNPVIIESFDKQDGFPAQQYFRNAVFKDREGKLYFGGDNGVVSFKPEELSNNVSYPEVTITDILSAGEKIRIKHDQAHKYQNPATIRDLILDHDQSNFSIHFFAPNYVNPKDTWYQYRLEGVHTQWQDLNKINAIFFNALNPGEYDLQIRASTEAGSFSEAYKSLRIKIKPPFWNTTWAYSFYTVSILGLLYLFFHITRKWERLSQNLRLEHLEREKEHEFHQHRIKFFTDISHELRTPLTLILAPLEKIATSSFGNARIQNQLILMLRNGERMLQLINQLLDLRKIETGHMKLQAAKGDIVHFVSEVCLAFKELARNRNISLDLSHSKEKQNVYFDRDKFEIILFNLLSNAIKYTPDNGRVEIEIFEDEKFHRLVKIRISNTGLGIPAAEIENIFDRFYSIERKSNSSQFSSGVGLEIVKKMIDLHKAEISVNSEFNEDGINGSTSFIITLPKGKSHLTEAEIIKDFKSSESIASYKHSNSKVSNTEEHLPAFSDKKQTILVVEDNPEVRKLIVDIFISEYNVLEAENGEKGIIKAKTKIPDLIISDIMMPVKDGIELCMNIKTDVKTSHIPVVLLTARTAVTFKYEGLETGADDFIMKPFNVEDLRLRVKNILKQRALLKEHYSRASSLIPEEITLNSVDEKLIKRTIDFINENMTESGLTIEKIAEEVGLSRVHFYRKIKAITGLSASDFLRKLRMERAAELLKTNKFNVSEVRNLVGISDADYFRNCFKKYYNTTPREFQDRYSNLSALHN